MPPRPVVTKITAQDTVRLSVHLENLGDAPLNGGHVFGRMIFKDGAVSPLMSFAYGTLSPGETTKLFINGVDKCTAIEVKGYRVNHAEAYPMTCLMRRGMFGWKLK